MAGVSFVLSCDCSVARLTEIVLCMFMSELLHWARCGFNVAFCCMMFSRVAASCVSLLCASFIRKAFWAKRSACE